MKGMTELREAPKTPFYFILPNQSDGMAIRIMAYTLHEAIEEFQAEYDYKDFQALTQAEYWRRYG